MYCGIQVIVERAEKSDIPEIDKKKLVFSLLLLFFFNYIFLIVQLIMSSCIIYNSSILILLCHFLIDRMAFTCCGGSFLEPVSIIASCHLLKIVTNVPLVDDIFVTIRQQ